VQKAGASQPGVSAALACTMARRIFLERCPSWSPYVPQVEREVCVIAETEAKRAARVAKAAAPRAEPTPPFAPIAKPSTKLRASLMNFEAFRNGPQ
jgi:hypothetical protein